MTPHRWNVTGWALLAAAAILAVISASLALDAVHGAPFQPYTTEPRIIVPTSQVAPAEFLRGVIWGVLAGVAFFAGIACFFWGALLDLRQQMTQSLEAQDARE